jgi:PAS domain S-box-containing protein
MEINSSLTIGFGLLSILLFSILLIKQKKIVLLENKITDTVKLIDDRLALADKYSKALASVADKTFEAVIITDKNGLIEYVNNGFTKITGYSFLEVVGKKPGEILQGAETDADTIINIREKLKEKTIFKSEILNYHKTGRKYWLSLSITPILDSKGEVEKFIAIESDITAQKKAFEELENKLKVASSL